MSPDLLIWLQERTALSVLSSEVLNAIAQVAVERVIPANERLVVEDTDPEALYILQQGRLESKRTNLTNPVWANSLLPGSAINLQELVLGQPVQRTVTALTECHLWAMPTAEFQQIVGQYPEIFQTISRQLAQELNQLTSALSYEQERAIALRPYLVTKVKRGIIGTSRYGVRLRQEIREAANNQKSVLIFGEPGLEKDNIASLIHFSSPQRRQPIIKVNCNLLQTSGADLFGRVGGKPGLLEWLGEGTLVLNNTQELPVELVPKIAQLQIGRAHV